MDTQPKHKGRSLRCPRCQLAFTISTTPVRCPRCGYLVPNGFVEAQSGCLTNFGISLAMGIGCALWAGAFLIATLAHQRHLSVSEAFSFMAIGFVSGVIVGWVTAVTVQRIVAEKLTLYVCSTGAVALITAALGAPALIVILSAIAIGFPVGMLLWRFINAYIACQA